MKQRLDRYVSGGTRPSNIWTGRHYTNVPAAEYHLTFTDIGESKVILCGREGNRMLGVALACVRDSVLCSPTGSTGSDRETNTQPTLLCGYDILLRE